MSSSLIRLEARFDAFFVEELPHALFAAMFGVAKSSLIELGVEIVFALFPGQFPAPFETVLRGAQHHGILFRELSCQRYSLLAQPVERHYAVHQTHRRRFGSREGIAG